MLFQKRVFADADQFVSNWAPTVLRFFQMFLGDQAQAENLTIETLREFVDGSTRARKENALVPVLQCALRNAATGHATPERITDPVAKALAKLEPKKRAAIVLFRGLSLDTRTISQITGMGQSEVRSLCMSAMEQLRTLLRPS